jgi:hypothetical protein
LEDGTFVLDTITSGDVYDFYARGMPSLPDPNDPTDAFICEWRICIDAINLFWDPTFFLLFKDYGDIFLGYDMGQIYSFHESKYIADFEPAIFHSYRLVTSDMVTYTLAIDGNVVYTGEVSPWAPWSSVQFGDSSSGRGSLSRWDYVRYGVTTIPEPAGPLLLVAAALGLPNCLRRRTR